MEIEKYDPGCFCWADLGTTDSEGAKKFYSTILGLDSVDMPMGDMGTYVMLQKDGKTVCALYQMPPEMMEAMPHPYWQSYICVEDADGSAQKAIELGGNVLMGPADVFDAGRMAIIQDATGAAVGLWQPKAHIGAQVFGEPGTLGWFELLTGDTDGASEFYGGLLGWTSRGGSAAAENGYMEFQSDGQSVAGMMKIQGGVGGGPAELGRIFRRGRRRRYYEAGPRVGRYSDDGSHRRGGGRAYLPPSGPTGRVFVDYSDAGVGDVIWEPDSCSAFIC